MARRPEEVVSNDGFNEATRPGSLLLVGMPSCVAIAIVYMEELVATTFAKRKELAAAKLKEVLEFFGSRLQLEERVSGVTQGCHAC